MGPHHLPSWSGTILTFCRKPERSVTGRPSLGRCGPVWSKCPWIWTGSRSSQRHVSHHAGSSIQVARPRWYSWLQLELPDPRHASSTSRWGLGPLPGIPTPPFRPALCHPKPWWDLSQNPLEAPPDLSPSQGCWHPLPPVSPPELHHHQVEDHLGKDLEQELLEVVSAMPP